MVTVMVEGNRHGDPRASMQEVRWIRRRLVNTTQLAGAGVATTLALWLFYADPGTVGPVTHLSGSGLAVVL